jgi:hypothetical protein
MIVNARARIVVLTILSLGVAMGISSTSAHRQKPASGDLLVPSHLRPIISRACLDCHTDQTHWPWYSRLPVVSLLIERDVRKGREHLNFSTWSANPHKKPTRNQLQEVCDAVSDNVMPPRAYRVLHPESRLSLQDVNALCDWADMGNSLSQRRTDEP